MQVREGMSPTVLTVGPGHTLRVLARLMSERAVGAAVVIDPDGHGPGIITERDILASLGEDQNPDAELVADHLTRDVVFAAPDWSLEEAAAAMVRGGFRHLKSSITLGSRLSWVILAIAMPSTAPCKTQRLYFTSARQWVVVGPRMKPLRSWVRAMWLTPA